jgi:hypothetical protein
VFADGSREVAAPGVRLVIRAGCAEGDDRSLKVPVGAVRGRAAQRTGRLRVVACSSGERTPRRRLALCKSNADLLRPRRTLRAG